MYTLMAMAGYTFPDLLRAKMKETGASQTELAERIGSTQPHISDLVNERKRPSREMVEAIAKALAADIDEFLLSAEYAPKSASGVWLGVPANWQELIPRTAHPPTEEELMRLQRIPLWFDLGNKDPRKDKSFWSLDRATRKRLLMHHEAIWDEYSELIDDPVKEGS